MKKIKTTITILAIAIFSISCSKPEDGAVGLQGETGTANVIYSDWATTPFTNSGSFWKSNINAPKITQEIIDKGNVLVYVKLGTQVLPLSYAKGSSYALFGYSLSHIDIETNSDYSIFPFRYIIIPGGVSVSAKTSQLNYKVMSYSEVCKQLNISE
jgi:hypothetical protein